MAIRIVVAVTDYDWFRVLSQIPDLSEINFWAPSPMTFRALRAGELFLFKLHAPRNVIVGGGIFAHSNIMPCSLAWEAFGMANGANSAEEMRKRIAKYRKSEFDGRRDFDIGCRILTQPFFLDDSNWIAPPQSWAKNIVTYKTYNTSDSEGLALWQEIQNCLTRQGARHLAEAGARYGEPHLVAPRLGQGGFRVLVTDVYDRRCAVTQERTLPALDAAHIRPYHAGGHHEASNGLLLRRDIHSLFDAGYVTVTPSLHFEVSRSIREEFENGRDYYALHGTRIKVPDRSDQRPNDKALAWHNDNVFKG